MFFPLLGPKTGPIDGRSTVLARRVAAELERPPSVHVMWGWLIFLILLIFRKD